MYSRFQRVILAVAMLVASSSALTDLRAQGLTGQISGTVRDASQGVLPGATVTIRNAATNLSRETVTDATGAFVFPDLLTGTYDMTVAVEGFKTYEQKGVVLGATERLALRAIVLEVGQLSEQVTVQAEAVNVQTQTAARSGLINRDQMDHIAIKGRDFAGLLQTLPGVVDTRNREAPGWGSVGGLTINGRASFNYSYDGITDKDTGSNSGNYAAPALDSIAEVRVQTSNFQAEYGRSAGASINVITRSGTKNFHGSAAYYKRDDSFNGNEYSRRQQGLPRPFYEYDNFAWTLGGPVLLPGGFNKNRNKLFFFWSQDILGRTDPGSLLQRRVPTALERAGDFSRTFDASARLVHIRDPRLSGNCNAISGGPACFPGNVIPVNRMDPIGRALLNLLPLPNAADPTGRNQYNYVFQTVQDWPRNDQVLRIDWNVAPNTNYFQRWQYGYEKRAGGVSFLGSTGAGWPQYPTKYEIDTVSFVNTLLHTFNPTTVMEVTAGMNWSHQYTSPLDQAAQDANDRTRVLPGLPQFFPEANPLNVLPQATFGGGVPGTIASFGVESRFPFFGFNPIKIVNANLTKVHGSHNMKVGIFVEHTRRPAAQPSSFNGTLNFNADGSNPGNTNIGHANALLGSITSYTESNAHPSAHSKFLNVEWYVQDAWRVTRNFTIDAGVRFYYIEPTRSKGDKVAMFMPGNWSATAAPLLIRPITTPQGRRAVNPVTGDVLPLIYLGRLAEGSGDPNNGLQVFDETVMDAPPIQVAPRLGFAWDVTGDGKSAVRGGVGVFYDRITDNVIMPLTAHRPLVDTRTTLYTTIPALLSSELIASPTSAVHVTQFDVPVVTNWSLGVQRDIGFSLVADVAYVGNAARRHLINREINGRPHGTRFQPENLDPTNVIGGRLQPLPDDFLRPYRGYANIAQREIGAYSDYHSLQFSVNRRRAADGLAFGVAYTNQLKNKSLGTIDPFVADNHARNYTSSGRRPHTLVINYAYEVPNLSRVWDNVIAKAVFDNWQVSGITSILSGTYRGITYGFSGVPTGMVTGNGAIGAGTASRVDIVCDPNLPRSERTFDRQFRTECVKPPSDPFRLGNAMGDELRGLGYMNWDISLFKNIPLGGTRRLQLRVELYNAFDADQWSGVDTGAQFNFLTGEQTDANFGRLTGATRDARRIQLGARFTF